MRYILKLRRAKRKKYKLIEYVSSSEILRNFSFKHALNYLYEYAYKQRDLQYCIGYIYRVLLFSPRMFKRYDSFFVWYKCVPVAYVGIFLLSYILAQLLGGWIVLLSYLFVASFYSFIWTNFKYLYQTYVPQGIKRLQFFIKKRRDRSNKYLVNTSLRMKYVLTKSQKNFKLKSVNPKRRWVVGKTTFNDYQFFPPKYLRLELLSFKNIRYKLSNFSYKNLDFWNDAKFTLQHHESYYINDLVVDPLSRSNDDQEQLKYFIFKHNKLPLYEKEFRQLNLIHTNGFLTIKKIYSTICVFHNRLHKQAILSCYALCWIDEFGNREALLALGPWFVNSAVRKPWYVLLSMQVYKEAFARNYCIRSDIDKLRISDYKRDSLGPADVEPLPVPDYVPSKLSKKLRKIFLRVRRKLGCYLGSHVRFLRWQFFIKEYHFWVFSENLRKSFHRFINKLGSYVRFLRWKFNSLLFLVYSHLVDAHLEPYLKKVYNKKLIYLKEVYDKNLSYLIEVNNENLIYKYLSNALFSYVDYLLSSYLELKQIAIKDLLEWKNLVIKDFIKYFKKWVAIYYLPHLQKKHILFTSSLYDRYLFYFKHTLPKIIIPNVFIPWLKKFIKKLFSVFFKDFVRVFPIVFFELIYLSKFLAKRFYEFIKGNKNIVNIKKNHKKFWFGPISRSAADTLHMMESFYFKFNLRHHCMFLRGVRSNVDISEQRFTLKAYIPAYTSFWADIAYDSILTTLFPFALRKPPIQLSHFHPHDSVLKTYLRRLFLMQVEKEIIIPELSSDVVLAVHGSLHFDLLIRLHDDKHAERYILLASWFRFKENITMMAPINESVALNRDAFFKYYREAAWYSHNYEIGYFLLWRNYRRNWLPQLKRVGWRWEFYVEKIVLVRTKTHIKVGIPKYKRHKAKVSSFNLLQYKYIINNGPILLHLFKTSSSSTRFPSFSFSSPKLHAYDYLYIYYSY